jgi:chromosome segregation ATPase
MEQLTDSRKRAFTGILVGGLAVATAFGIYQAYRSSEISDERDRFTIQSDSLMTVKKNLEEEINGLTKDLSDERDENAELVNKTEYINGLLAEKEKVLTKLNREAKSLRSQNKSKDEQMAILNNQIIALNDVKALMERNLTDLQSNNANLISENTEWKAKYDELRTQSEELNKQIASLNKKVDDIIYDSPADNFKVEVLKPNSKVTAKAKKANTLKVSFVVPEMVKTSTENLQTLYLSILDDKNVPIKGAEKEVSVMRGEKLMPVAVHATQIVDYSKNPQSTTFMFDVKQKLTPGTYKATVYSNSDYLGTVEFKVRNSFLFF